MKNLYEILGVAKDAIQDTIKKAHRQGVKKHHPDKGGDEDKFREIQHAYNVLGDEKRRKKYDETGDDTETLDEFTSRFASFLDAEVVSAIEKSRSLEFDVLTKAKKKLSDEIKSAEDALKEYNKHVDKILTASLKVSMKTEGKPNLIIGLMEEKVKLYMTKIKAIEDSIEFCNNALDEMEDYTYSFDKEEAEKRNPFEAWLTVKLDDNE